MEIIDGYFVTSSNSSKKQLGSVIVKAPNGAVAARVKTVSSNPLALIRKYLMCEERLELIRQLEVSKVPEETIAKIVEYKGKVKAIEDAHRIVNIGNV